MEPVRRVLGAHAMVAAAAGGEVDVDVITGGRSWMVSATPAAEAASCRSVVGGLS